MPSSEGLAALIKTAGGSFVLEQVALQGPGQGELLVAIHGVGICHSDLAARDQQLPTVLPAILGHEGAGEIIAVGQGVDKFRAGDRVVLSFGSCGTCRNCRDKAPSYCDSFLPLNMTGGRPGGSRTVTMVGNHAVSDGFFGQSSFAEYSLVDQRNAIKVPSDLPTALLGPLGCGVQTGAGTVLRSLDCKTGSSIVIFGGGTVGLSALLGAMVRDCAVRIVIEPHQARRELAMDLGATAAFAPDESDLTGVLMAASSHGFDYIVDTTTRPDALAVATVVLAKRGTLALLGVPSDPGALFQHRMLSMIGAGQRVIGVNEGDSDPQEFIPELIALFRDGRLPFERLVRAYPLSEINRAVRDQLDGICIKPVLFTQRGADGVTDYVF